MRSLRKARPLLDLDRLHDERWGSRGHGTLLIETESRDDLFGLRLGAELQLLALGSVLVAAPANQSRGEGVDAIFDKKSIDGPRLDRHECVDLHLAIDDQAHRHGLHSARGQSGPHLAPQQWRQPVADQTIDHPARLLRGDQRTVDLSRMRERRVNRELGDLVEDDPVGIAQSERLGQMPGDGLALAIGVGREERRRRLLHGRAQIADLLLLALDELVLRGETVVDVDADLRLGQIADVAHGGEHDVLGTEKPGERSRLAGRLDDDQT